MSLKTLAFFTEVKRKVVKIQRHSINAPKVTLVLRKSVPIYCFEEKNEFVSFYIQNNKSFRNKR